MKSKLLLLFCLLFSFNNSFSQAPVVYINFVTHNEPGDNLQNPFNFNKSKTLVQQLATIMNTKAASWNLETCDGFANGALNLEGATSNIFRTLANPPFNDNIEIDPRNKNMTNIADLYYVLDSLGANPTNTLGGFIYQIVAPATGSPDWFQYEDTIYGITYPQAKWKCDLIWGAGSLDPHTGDLNDYGIWKPDTTDNFYTHNPNRSLWYIGNGCQPWFALDSVDNEQDVIDLIQGVVDSVQSGMWPQDKFYNYSVTFNQNQFGPMLFSKISKIIDSVNAMDTTMIQWKTLTQKFGAFEDWQISTGKDSSQWNCGDYTTGIEKNEQENFISVFPNPGAGFLTVKSEAALINSVQLMDVSGRIVLNEKVNSEQIKIVNLTSVQSGLYILKVEAEKGSFSKRIVISH